MGALGAKLETLFGDLDMWKYVVQDLLGALKYAPYGILIGGLLYFILLRFQKRKDDSKKAGFSFVYMIFLIYMAIMVVITFLSREGGGSARIDLQIGSSLGINSRNDAYIAENILLFVPYGFLLKIVWKKESRFWMHLGLGFLTSFGIECLQLVSGRGIFQIDDIITNTLGAVLGYFLCCFICGRKEKK